MRNLGIIGAGIMLAVLVSCGSEPNGMEDNFDRSKILNNVTDNIILPAWRDLVDHTADLQSKFQAFEASANETTLKALKASWLQARLSWKACEPFKFGPLESRGLENAVDLWPVSTSGIETAISNYNGSDSYLTQIGSDRKGFGSIEYLLLATSDAETLTALADANRKAYLGLLIDELAEIAATIQSDWTGGYADEFRTDLGNDAGASTTLMANELIYHVEVTKNYRLETPLGIRSGSATPLPETLESYYAHESKALIGASLDITLSIFTGDQGSGFDDYLDELNIDDGEGKALSEVIVEQIQLCQSDLAAINGTLAEALESDKTAVEKLYVDLKELTLLIKTDMMSQLGLLVVFSDNDGD